ncbi:GTPase ObgE [Candidatus Phytoplasma phoenicium]|uniref:GTPase Obg n=1 Tax=Candidatus Phytoplasma phoenicium TaxID=198422 RepID=A0A0L0MJT2_9MOLU|nr:GTPase ObgE [Candidatus Phytoplasma phoenicium]KND62536.1 GTP-binding protein ObgE [Candidatus Phytoplasma phoenicium]
MNFIDETINFVKAGKGGNGIVAFRREKYVPYGGPAGGNGGNGGSVFFIGDTGLNTLLKFRYQQKIVALSGSNGKNKNKNGAKADDLFIKVPLGTTIYNHETNQLIGEILKHQETLMIAKGGKGGRGNYTLANFKNKVPSFAEKGDLGDSLTVRVELKMLADIGLVGCPNVGKSSLISALSNAKSKVGNYSFTTLNPILGVVGDKDFSFTIADIPGLVKNAHLGRGMGIAFLKHIERCKLLVHVCSAENINIYENYCHIINELKQYKEKILEKPQIVVLNKIDLPGALSKLNTFQKNLTSEKIIPISVYNHTNLFALKYCMMDILKNLQSTPSTLNPNTLEHKIFSLPKKTSNTFYIMKDQYGDFVIKGAQVEKLFHRTDLNNYESVQKFSYILKKIGVETALKKQGIKPKDKVKICDYVFELVL